MLLTRKYTVYKHTNKSNGKVYVGITKQAVERRWQNGHGYAGTYFWNAIKKYGWDGFEHEVLFTGLTKEAACDMERFLIKYYQSNNREYGYNVSIGGETCDCITVRAGADNPKSQAVIRTDQKTGEKIRFATMAAAANEIDGNYKGIVKACRGTLNTYKGYVWEYADGDYVKPEKYAIGKYPHTKQQKSVRLTETDGTVRIFESVKEASSVMNCPKNTLNRYLHKTTVDRSGRVWEYAN